MTTNAPSDDKPAGLRFSAGLGPLEPQPPNASGQTMCHVRWIVDMPDGWLGAWDKKAFGAYVAAAVSAERERCAAICDQRSADHWHDYKDRASPLRGDGRAEAASDEAEECAKAIRGPNGMLSGCRRQSA